MIGMHSTLTKMDDVEGEQKTLASVRIYQNAWILAMRNGVCRIDDDDDGVKAAVYPDVVASLRQQTSI